MPRRVGISTTAFVSSPPLCYQPVRCLADTTADGTGDLEDRTHLGVNPSSRPSRFKSSVMTLRVMALKHRR